MHYLTAFVFLPLLKSALQLLIPIFLCLGVGASWSVSVPVFARSPKAGSHSSLGRREQGGTGVSLSPCTDAAPSPLPEVPAEQSWEVTTATHRWSTAGHRTKQMWQAGWKSGSLLWNFTYFRVHFIWVQESQMKRYRSWYPLSSPWASRFHHRKRCPACSCPLFAFEFCCEAPAGNCFEAMQQHRGGLQGPRRYCLAVLVLKGNTWPSSLQRGAANGAPRAPRRWLGRTPRCHGSLVEPAGLGELQMPDPLCDSGSLTDLPWSTLGHLQLRVIVSQGFQGLKESSAELEWALRGLGTGRWDAQASFCSVCGFIGTILSPWGTREFCPTRGGTISIASHPQHLHNCEYDGDSSQTGVFKGSKHLLRRKIKETEQKPFCSSNWTSRL